MKLRLILPIFFSLCVPLLSGAQESEPLTDNSTTTKAVLTDAASGLWYDIERLNGKVDVGDFVVGPGRAEVSLKPGETTTRYITVANRISDDRAFELSVVDIAGTADGSSAIQVIEGQRGPYSILDYIAFPENTIELNLGERARIPVKITLPPDAEPGGYYGSILVSTVRTSKVAGEGALPQSPVIARVGSHLFITVEGEQEISGQTIDLTVLPSKLWYESGPLTFGIAYENTGSVHLNPYGELSIMNTFGEEVGYVEVEPWFVLPKSIRTREINWNKDFLFGRYTAKVTMNRGYDNVLDEYEVAFWVLPWKLLLLIFGSIFLVTMLFRTIFRNFEFKRRS